jgi:hypothetical protein
MSERTQTFTLLPHNLANTMQEATESRTQGCLIVYELDFYRFHGRDGQYGLANAGAETAK